MYEFDPRYPMGLNLTMAKTFEKGLGTIQPSGAHLFPGGMGQIVPSEAHLFGQDLSGIESCGCGCQNASMGTVSQIGGRPWWHWLALGVGIGGVLYMAKKSGIIGNPDEMTDSEAAQQAAAIAVQAGLPTILWGAPGIGKTSWLEALGKAMGAKVFTVIGSTKDPADIGGIMNIDGTLIPPRWANEIRQRSIKGKMSVLFLDEFSSMSPLVHAALLRVVRDKIAGETDFDPKWGPLRGNAVHVVCAANRPEEGAGAIDLPPPAANRLIHIDWPTPSPAEWGLGLMFGWTAPRLFVLPKDWKRSEAMRSAKEDIAQFIRLRDELMLKMPKTPREAGEAWPSPRSWEMAAEALGAARVAGAPKDVQYKLIEGSVGAGAAGELFAWIADKDLPDAEQLLADPTSWPIPEDRPDKLYVAGQSVVNAVRRKPTAARWEKAWDFIAYVVDKTGAADTMALPASELFAMKRDERFKKELKNVKLPAKQLKAFKPIFLAAGLLKGK